LGFYFNPSNIRFAISLHSKIYVDKSGIIAYTNEVLYTEQRFVCISRPRRFGKTMTAYMLSAYYNLDSDSSDMFDNLKIASDSSYKKHLNKYNVVFLNIQQFLSESSSIENMIGNIKDLVTEDILNEYPEINVDNSKASFIFVLQTLFKISNAPIVFIIDEWDCIFREYRDDTEEQKKYLDFLRNVLKDREYVALAYMTGILPIKKNRTQSALNMFSEFSMTDPDQLAEYVGFTQNEVMSLCKKYKMDYEEMAEWYDGYSFPDMKTVYNPKSVVEALLRRRFNNYWTRTEAYEDLKFYIRSDFDDLKDAIIQLLAGERKRIDIRRFNNDMTSLESCNNILTLLIHLGYLGYDFETKEVFIPNKEISNEFVSAISSVGWDEIASSLEASEDLLKATWNMDAKAVAEGIEKAHNETSIIKYNDENALSCVISIAYYSARNYYTLERETPAGKGFADLFFRPRKNHLDKPAMVIELKWDKSAKGAIEQIENKKYTDILKDYRKNALLIGINYDKSSKHHECRIKKYK